LLKQHRKCVDADEGEFSRVPGLKLENWMQEPG
jgi:hypothetical protein